MSKVHMTVLGFINYKPMYGYEILNIISTKKMDVWAGIKMPSVYNALQLLENKKYIVGKQQIEGNNPPRMVYTMTEIGKEYFVKLVKSYLQNDIVGVDYWLGISFTYKTMSKNEFLTLVNSRLSYLKSHLENDMICEKTLMTDSSLGNVPFIHKHLFAMGTGVHKVEMEILEKILIEAQLEKNEDYFLKDGEI